MQTNLVTILRKFGGNPAICLRKKTIFVKSLKSPDHVTFDFDLYVEQHILDAGRAWKHCVQVWWRSNHLRRRKMIFFAKSQSLPFPSIWTRPLLFAATGAAAV